MALSLLLGACGSSASPGPPTASPTGSGGILLSPSPSPELSAGSPSPSAPPIPSASDVGGSGVTGTWEGTWKNDPQWGTAHGGFTMTLVQSGTDFTGTTDVTGPTCVRKGSSKGSVDGNQIKFGWLAAARTVQFVGTLSGNSMSGTWTATACTAAIDISGTWAAHRTSP